MSSKSNDNGRALEYIIADNLGNSLISDFTPRAYNDQSRDKSKLKTVTSSDLKAMFTGADHVKSWLLTEFPEIRGHKILIDRLPDDAAKNGDPTDINIKNDLHKDINLSIKFNHDAIKHPRPSNLGKQCGFQENSTIVKTYREQLKLISNKFFSESINISSKISTFSELKDLDINYINKNLYKPVNELVVDFINQNVTGRHSQAFYSFIFGKTEHYKLKVTKSGNLRVQHNKPADGISRASAALTDDSHIKLSFSDITDIDLRLHTASSRIAACSKNCCSLKFDVQYLK